MPAPVEKMAAALLLLVWAGLAFAAVAAAAEPPGARERREELPALEEAIRLGINEVRREHDRAPLAADPALARLAREYSRRMAGEGFFAHSDPAGRSMVDRLQEAGISYRMAGENIFRSFNVPDPVQAAIDGWMASPGHRENILNPEFRETGVGIWKKGETFYFTQIFLRRGGGPAP